MSFTHSIKKLGFSDKKTSIYITLMSHGDMTVKELVDKTGLIRTTIYETLEQLIKDRLVSSTINNDGKKIFCCEDPENLEKFIDDKAKKILAQKANLELQQLELKQLIPQLKTLSNNIIGKPKITFYDGAKGLVEALNDVLLQKKPIKIYGSYEQWQKWMPDHFEWYKHEIIKRKIEIKQIEQKSIQDLREQKDKATDPWPKKFLPIGFSLPGFSIIYGEKILLASFQKPMATVIEDKEYSKTQHTIYDLFWQFIKS